MDKIQQGENQNCEKVLKLDLLGKIVLSVFLVGMLTLSYFAQKYEEPWKNLVDPSVIVVMVGVCSIFARAIPTFVKGKINEYAFLLIAVLFSFVLGVLSVFDVVETTKNYLFVSGCTAFFGILMGYVADGFIYLSRKKAGEGTPKMSVVDKTKKLSFVLSIVAISVSVIVFIVSYLWRKNILDGIESAICALTVFTPFNLWISTISIVNYAKGSACAKLIDFDGKNVFEKISDVRAVAFDEYVLMENVRVEKIVSISEDEDVILSYAKSLSLKKVEKALNGYKNSDIYETSERVEGDGFVKAIILGKSVEIVTTAYLAQNFSFDESVLSRTDCITFFVVVDGIVAGAILLGYDLSDSGRRAIELLKKENVATILLSQNSGACFNKIKNGCNFDDGYCNLFGGEKEYRIAELRFKNDGSIVFVTENDAKTDADLVVSTNKDEDVGDIRIEDGNLQKLPYLFKLSRKVFSKIRFNIVFSIFISAVFVVEATFGALDTAMVAIIQAVTTTVFYLNAYRLTKIK